MTNAAQAKNPTAHRPSSARLTRRDLLKTAAAAGVAAVPCSVPARALGRDGKVAPSERILVGGLGLGGRGRCAPARCARRGSRR
jgi:hypothetical protein